MSKNERRIKFEAILVCVFEISNHTTVKMIVQKRKIHCRSLNKYLYGNRKTSRISQLPLASIT